MKLPRLAGMLRQKLEMALVDFVTWSEKPREYPATLSHLPRAEKVEIILKLFDLANRAPQSKASHISKLDAYLNEESGPLSEDQQLSDMVDLKIIAHDVGMPAEKMQEWLALEALGLMTTRDMCNEMKYYLEHGTRTLAEPQITEEVMDAPNLDELPDIFGR